jgi:hypothetical protein
MGAQILIMSLRKLPAEFAHVRRRSCAPNRSIPICFADCGIANTAEKAAGRDPQTMLISFYCATANVKTSAKPGFQLVWVGMAVRPLPAGKPME